MDCDSLDPIPSMFIVMELVSTDLRNLISNIDILEIDEEHSIILMYNMLCAVNFMHTSNIVHRDIKPSNILLFDNCEMKICDFGLSRSLPRSDMLDYVEKLDSELNLNKVSESLSSL